MNKKNILLVLIFVLGFALRFWDAGKAPPGLNRDEASIGYTAYSILKTGKDEYGISYPLSFKSFGDWKLPFYIYTTVPFVKIFGLTDTAVRLPSVIFGSLTILVTYFLAKNLFAQLGDARVAGWRKKIPLLAAFLFAVSPWSVHLSRTASEANSAVFFTASGILLYLLSYKNAVNLIFASILLSLSLSVYAADHIFAVILFAGLTAFSIRRYAGKFTFWASAVIFVLFSFLIYSQTLLSADKTKISGLLALGDPSLVYQKITLDRLQHQTTLRILPFLLHNKLTFSAENILQNYIKGFSPEFLFINGGGNEQHNIPDFGNLYIWEAPFLVLGLAYLLTAKGSAKKIMLFWLLISPVAASITKDAPHTARMAAVMPLLDILIAYGVIITIESKEFGNKIISGVFPSILTVLFIFNFMIWNDRYFLHFPYKQAEVWGEGYQKLVSVLDTNQNFNAKEIVMSRPEYSPYIYFLFYNKVDPSLFQNSVVRYPQTQEGFQHVAQIGNLSFRQIDWSDDLAIPDRVYVEWSSELPKSATDSSRLVTEDLMKDLVKNNKDISNLTIGDRIISQKIAEIRLQNNDSMFTIIKTAKFR